MNGTDIELLARQRLAKVLERAENRTCADCSEPEPMWASTNWGVFICTQCAGVHRSLGVEHSFVLSCALDDWTDAQVDHMAANGNTTVNQLLEYSVPKTIEVPCLALTDRDTREGYIRAKYVTQLFRQAEGKAPRPPERVPRRGTNNSLPQGKSGCNAAMVEFIGIVSVEVIECRDLIIKDLTSSDPYCVLTLGMQTRKTTVKYSTLNPRYEEHFRFSWNGLDTMEVELFDKDELTKDDHMGKLSVNLEPLLKEEGVVMRSWFRVHHRKHEDRNQGVMLMEITFSPIK